MKAFSKKPTLTLLSGISMFIMALPASPTWSQGHAHSHSHKDGDSHKSEKAKETKYLFGNHQCPVTGETVVPESFVEARNEKGKVYGKIYLCCQGCEKRANKDFNDLYNKFYRTDKKTGKFVGPQDLKNRTCPVSGEPIETDSSIEYNGMMVHFCCAGCVKGFLKDPDPKLVKLVPDLKPFEYQRPAGSGTSQ